MALTNKLVNYLLSTFRHQQIIVWFCCPYRDFLDSQSMKLLHLGLETISIDRKRNLCKLKISIFDYNSSLQKFYFHSLAVYRGGMVNKMRFVYARLPPKELIVQYEAKKKAFTSQLNQQILREIDKLEGKQQETKPQIDKRKPLTDKQKDVLELLAKYNGKVSDVEANSNFKSESVYFHQVQARKKGYFWKEFQQKEGVSLGKVGFG